MQLEQDLRYAFRKLRRSPGFALTAILTLALGVGATTAVFSVIDAVLLRPLPFPDPQQIVVPESRSHSGYTQPASLPGYRDERAQQHTFSAFAGYNDFSSVNLESPHGPVALHATKGTDNFFDVFGVRPILGRTFLHGEDQPGRDDVAVLSYEVWQRDFQADPKVIGKMARLDGHPYTIIGVMPADFRYPLGQRNSVYTPLHAKPEWITSRENHWLRTIGRMKPGVSRQQAQADLQQVFANIGRAYPDTDGGRTVVLHTLDATLSEGVASPLTAMGAAVLAVLMLCCVNIAGLLLARGVGREREMAVRAAVGAGRATILRQVLTESLVLAAFGCGAGVLLATLLLAGMRTFLIDALQRGSEVHLNDRALAVAIVLATVTSVLAGVLPALRLAGIDPSQALRAGGAAGSTRAHHRLRSAFIVTQVALALVLLFTSGLLVRSIFEQRHTDLGFHPAPIVSAEIDLSPGRYTGRDPMGNFYQPLLDRLQHAPGVAAAGLISTIPIQNWGINSDVHIKGQPPYPPNQEMLAENRIVTNGYYKTFGIRLIRGRLLHPGLDTAAAHRVVVNEAFVKKFFPQGGEPVGAHIDGENAEIVGVVSNVRQALDRPPLAEMDYLANALPVADPLDYLSGMSLVVRAEGDPKAIYGELREAIHAVDPTVPFRTPETMDEIVLDQLNFQRMESWLFGGFAALALLLAIVGIYGLLSHEVEQGTRDIGVRMALGATRANIVRTVTGRAAAMVAAGLAAGTLLTLLASRAIAAVLPQVYESHRMHAAHLSAQQASVFAVLAAALFLISLLAAMLPAKRAATIEPMTALRME
ncbi:MAG TPA: ABC transporter permease [Acidobacteriaceae bacterium]|jgi:predicted permease